MRYMGESGLNRLEGEEKGGSRVERNITLTIQGIPQEGGERGRDLRLGGGGKGKKETRRRS